ncbi:hypothetical protein CHLRE_14g613150v5 [Chlamydomonas reinhardtii]|uniref:Uncharacterized protein n=1 Tax=Chlamydomonas reinhardtii TaxID=3055 RepID=A0A2K3CXD7_CHLRE|nr:uncharacterized protein CHLRE_14g613150v5 [Chlamydomonas reinhardtii]PNW72957.1 hypothetical protein CHLRE_14g613150v5 [Chlamydomonas reinhardtii]
MTARELAGAARTRSRSRESGLLNIPLWRGFIVAAIFLFAALLVAGPKRAAGASWFRHPNCTSPCSEADHTCTDANINSCRYAWGSCPNGTVQTALGSAVDMADCLPPTDCTPGGCEEGWAEVAKTACIDVKKCLAHAGFCYSETCCRVKPQATCCPQLDCTVRYEDCDVAQQRVLNDTSRSDVGRTRIAHTGSAAFPFYSAPHVPAPGGSAGAGGGSGAAAGAGGGGGGGGGGVAGGCEAVRVWGRCFCNDGASVPGCDPFNSSTWTTVSDGEADPLAAAADPARRLPPGLSQLCVVLPPDSPPPAAPSSAASPSPSASPLPGPGTAGEDADYEEGSGTGNGTHARQAGRKDNGEQHAGGGSTAGHQARVAVVVVACVLAAGGCVLGVSWCCGLLPDVRSLLRLRGATYEPMFTGQSYTPGLTSPPSATAPADIPWNRFLAALQDLYGRVRYGRRYRLEGESAAAAAERYRRLISNAGGTGNSSWRGQCGDGGGGGGEAYHGPGLGGGPAGGGGGYGVGPDGLGGGRLEEEEEDEVFTLDERPARPVGLMVPAFGRRSSGGPLGGGGGGGGGRLGLGAAGGWQQQPASAELEMGQVASGPGSGAGGGGYGGGRVGAAAPAAFHHHHHHQQQQGGRANQFGTTGPGAGGGGGSGTDGWAASAGDVIHTRAMRLDSSDGGQDVDDGDEEDLDAPIHMPLTTPQTTGQDAGRRR